MGAIVANAGAGLRWLARTPSDLAEVRESFELIVSDGRHAAEVIQGLRSMFQSKELAPGSIDLNQLIHEVLALVQGALQRHRIIVRTQLDGTLGPVTGNRVQLQQVLFNLVNNAIEAMESALDRKMRIKSGLESGGDVRVTVKIRRRDRPERYR